MAEQPHAGNAPSWPQLQELLRDGDPAFVDELRQIADADLLGALAGPWYEDRRPASRRLLFDYLNRPLNAYRHEVLVKRLFKLAERATDDEVMGRFLVLFDRSIRRARRRRRHSEWQTFESRDAALALVRRWEAEGADNASLYEWNDRFHVYGRWTGEMIRIPRETEMPRGRIKEYRDYRGRIQTVSDLIIRLRMRETPPPDPKDLPQPYREKLKHFRLFSVHTRHYLRRRAWRYFRKLGKQQPERYIPAVANLLKLYEDPDVASGLALIDNWGLVHILFHHSPVLIAKANGWTLAEGRTLAELHPAPMYEALWRAAPRALIDLLKEARCRPVRQWAIHLIRAEHGAALAALPLDELLGLLAHEDAEVVTLAAEALRQASGLEGVTLDRWLALLETPNPAGLEILCELMATKVRPEQLTLAQVVGLAGSRPLPVARLGFTWLRSRKPQSDQDCRALLGLVEAEAEALRPELVRWAREVLNGSPLFQAGWVLEYLDSRHADVRAEGWAWLQQEPRARDDVQIWQRLLESPYDDVRLSLVADLEQRVAQGDPAAAAQAALDPELVRFLWASVLLNIHRGGRTKPVVVQQMVRRASRRPEEAPLLLPILGVALRSIRGPEWRAGLAGVVRLVEQHPELEGPMRQAFPELTWNRDS